MDAHQIEIQQLRGFLAVAKTKSFSRAAEKTFRSQSAVSLQISELEKRLGGIKLLNRKGGKEVSLTLEGEAFRKLAIKLLDNFDALKIKFFEHLGRMDEGPLRIATHTSVMAYILPEVIKRFKEKFPACDVSLFNRGRQDILTMVSQGDADIGITSINEPEADFDYTVFANFNRVLVTPKDHRFATKKRLTFKDIASEPLLLPPIGSNTRKIIDLFFLKKNLDLKIALEATGRLATKSYIELGLGVSIMNAFYLTPSDWETFFVKDVSDLFETAQRGIITRKGCYLPQRIKSFVSMLTERYKCV